MVYLYGLHACKAALDNKKRVIEKIFAINQKKLDELHINSSEKFCVQIVDKHFLDKLLPGGAVHQGLVLQVKPLQYFDLTILKQPHDVKQTIVVLDQVTDTQNIGSILRLCMAFDVDAIVMTNAHMPQETGAMAKISSGGLEVVPRCAVVNLASSIKTLKNWGFWFVGLSEHATKSLREIDLKGKVALTMGSEGDGMRKLTEDMCDFKAFLPTSKKFSTLNVTTATAIALYEVFTAQNS